MTALVRLLGASAPRDGVAWTPGAAFLSALAFAVTLLWFATLDARHLVHPDEGRYAEIAREMAVTGDWLTPRLNDLKYFDGSVQAIDRVPAELKALYKEPGWAGVQRHPSGWRFPNGESFPEMQQRIVGAIERLRLAHPGQVIVLVSHADPIKAAVAHAMGTHIDLFQRIVISPCSVTAIAYSPGGPVVLTVNSTGGSLAELRPS